MEYPKDKMSRNWKNPEDCEYLKQASMHRWAWEFLRRNPEYKKDYEKLLPKAIEERKSILSDPFWKGKNAKAIQGIKENKPDSINFNVSHHSLVYYRKWGVSYFPHPENDNPKPTPFSPMTFCSGSEVTASGLESVYKETTEDKFIAILFDLELPIKPQIQRVQQNLLAKQKLFKSQNKIKIMSPRKRQDNWIVYLRVFDAMNDKTKPKYKEIASILFPKYTNQYPDYQGNRMVKEAYRAAKVLINGGYRNILPI